MVETQREVERKYEGPEGGGLPPLQGVPGVADAVHQGVEELDAVYYDTADGRLAAASITLRRRTGGTDAGWHLKLPVSLADGVRDEIRAPLSDAPLPDAPLSDAAPPAAPPHALTALVRSRVRGAELVPVVRLRSARDLTLLVDASGAPLAEVSVDRVDARRLDGTDATARWTEAEAELAAGADPVLLDRVERGLFEAGWYRSAATSKLGRALRETATAPGCPQPPLADAAGTTAPSTAGGHVLAYLRAQRDALLDLDPAVRRDLPDAVHRMRVATRRLRSALRSYGKVLDRRATRPLRGELKWLAGELGVDRDQEVLTERLLKRLGELPDLLRTGPVGTRLRTWSLARSTGSRRRLIAVLDGARYLDLLAALDTLVAPGGSPPLRAAAADDPSAVLSRAVRRDFDRLALQVWQAVGLAPGAERDLALHDARKQAKRARYTAEAARDALGDTARDLVRDMKSLQGLLGDHQDSVMTREALRDLAAQAHAAGESTFTYGLLYGREEQKAALCEAALPEAWESIERERRTLRTTR